MEQDETFLVKGIVSEIKRNNVCIVDIEVNGIVKKISASISGKIRNFRIKITKGDNVKVLITKYDLTQGRITYREAVEKNK